MSASLTHQLHQSRITDLHRRAARRHAQRTTVEETVMEPSITIRRATPADAADVVRLATLDTAPTPSGDTLIAFVGGEPQAAIEIATGLAVADPFRPTADLVELLVQRAKHMSETTPARRRLPFGLPSRVSGARG